MSDQSTPTSSNTFSGLSAAQTVRWDEWQRDNGREARRSALHVRVFAAGVMVALLGTLAFQLFGSPVVG